MALKITLDPYKDVFVVAPMEFPPKKNLVVVPSSMLTKGQNVRWMQISRCSRRGAAAEIDAEICVNCFKMMASIYLLFRWCNMILAGVELGIGTHCFDSSIWRLGNTWRRRLMTMAPLTQWGTSWEIPMGLFIIWVSTECLKKRCLHPLGIPINSLKENCETNWHPKAKGFLWVLKLCFTRSAVPCK